MWGPLAGGARLTLGLADCSGIFGNSQTPSVRSALVCGWSEDSSGGSAVPVEAFSVGSPTRPQICHWAADQRGLCWAVLRCPAPSNRSLLSAQVARSMLVTHGPTSPDPLPPLFRRPFPTRHSQRPPSAQPVYCIPVPSLYILPPQSSPCHPGGDWWRGRLATRRPAPAPPPTLSRHPAASPVLAPNASPPPLPAHPPAGALLCLRVTAASRRTRLVGCGAGGGLRVFAFPAPPFPPPSVHVTCARVGRWVRFPRHCRH